MRDIKSLDINSIKIMGASGNYPTGHWCEEVGCCDEGHDCGRDPGPDRLCLPTPGMVSEEALLAFVNNRDDISPFGPGIEATQTVSTAIYGSIPHGWSIAACFSPNPHPRAYEDTDAELDEDTDGEVDGGEGSGEWRNSQKTPYWGWDRFDGRVACREVADEDAAEAQAKTTNWKFQRRDGATAVGSEPLDYFSDWDSDNGDVAIPTPHGEPLRSFRQSHRTIRRPPEGAIWI
ncbi:Uu.00g003950.m01.CDS01 [Anthostomella pinea]|uniref:Uu.00g003950.m01.CDS01 n=1 Tax=Anthostomella pinea TaxID=933095 RepID=A0AAI8VKZ8_9PEZI|nr:Uu.00g003950.m01.CDS01 [Anthostomella pinea]